MNTPAKIKFQRLGQNQQPEGAAFEVQYNPTEYSLNKGAKFEEVGIPGLDMPILQFVRGQTQTLTLDLFFDTTDQGMGKNAVSVTTLTEKFCKLVKIDSHQHAPPVCLVSWGEGSFPGGMQGEFWIPNTFKCVVESVRQRHMLFSPEGVPLRAILTVSLKEYKSLQDQINELNLQSSDHTKVHLVQEGETLARIAAKRYDDPTEWRRIAEHNQIYDPLALQPGMALELPPTR